MALPMVVGGARLLLLTRIWSLERFFGPAPHKKKEAPVCVCHPKHKQAGPTRVRVRYRSFYVRSKFRTFTWAGWADVHSPVEEMFFGSRYQ